MRDAQTSASGGHPPGLPGVTQEQVRWCYRILLGREPEDEAVIETWRRFPALDAVVREFLLSAEFQASRQNSLSTLQKFFWRQNRPNYVEYEPDVDRLRLLFDRVARTWLNLGEVRPHWSVLSSDEFAPENIDTTEAAFYASGAPDCATLLATLRRVGRSASELDTLLEFGCGLGRVTNYLAEHFNHVIGCDISTSHLALARKHSDTLTPQNLTYRQVTMPDFGLTEPVDVWYSIIVLQHNPPPVMAEILRRAFGALKPRGLAVFQIPTFAPNYRFVVDEYLSAAPSAYFDMHVLPQHAVFELVREANCRVLEVVEDGLAGNPAWLSNSFVVERMA